MARASYSAVFERDYAWYLQWASVFDFDGSSAALDKVRPDPVGKPAKDCFYAYDSTGKILPCCEPELLLSIYKCKGSINFHIKLWAEGLAERTLWRSELEGLRVEFDLLPWMVQAIWHQAAKIGIRY